MAPTHRDSVSDSVSDSDRSLYSPYDARLLSFPPITGYVMLDQCWVSAGTVGIAPTQRCTNVR